MILRIRYYRKVYDISHIDRLTVF